jgi:hypothetical protein
MSIWNKDSISSPNSPRTLYIHQAKLDFTAVLLPQPAECWGCRWERATMPRLGFISIRNVEADSQNWPSRITSNTFKITESINTIWQTQANEDVQGGLWVRGESAEHWFSPATCRKVSTALGSQKDLYQRWISSGSYTVPEPAQSSEPGPGHPHKRKEFGERNFSVISRQNEGKRIVRQN